MPPTGGPRLAPRPFFPAMNKILPQSSSSSSPPLIGVEKLTITRGKSSLLTGIDWTVRQGEHWAVLGGNGAGKSTLLEAVLGRIWPDQAGGGRIIWNLEGREETSPLAVRAASAMISPKTQGWYLQNADDLSGEELLLCGLYGTPRIYRKVAAADRAKVRAGAEAFGLNGLLSLPLEAMSQGQLRRMLIVSALLAGPRILVLDEAADGLDAQGREDLFALLTKLAAGGENILPGEGPVTMLMAAHREEDLPAFITHALWLEKGRVHAQGPVVADESLLAPQGSPGVSLISPSISIEKEEDHPSASILELRNVSVFLGRRRVLRGLNWRVREGEHWAIVGPGGSGKTTLLRLIWGEIPAALGGELRWFGRPGPFNIPALRRKIGLVSDRVHQAMPGDMLAEDVVVSGFFGSIGLYEEPTSELYLAAAEMLRRLDLNHLAGRTFGTLSFGEARRLLLARALTHAPALLLLDEALSGLDADSRAAFLRDLSLAAQSRVTQIIQVSHHPQDFIPEINNILRLKA